MNTHTLKIKEVYYWQLHEGNKKCEIRFNDRDFQKGDIIEFDVSWTGEVRCGDFIPKRFKITHVLHFPEGLKDGYVALSISPKK